MVPVKILMNALMNLIFVMVEENVLILLEDFDVIVLQDTEANIVKLRCLARKVQMESPAAMVVLQRVRQAIVNVNVWMDTVV